jgi:hypothetical protein
MNFEITPEQHERINTWLMTEVYPPVIERQRRGYHGHSLIQFAEHDWAAGYPYQGANGGGVTYEFTPTSIGVVFKVKAYDQTLDLSDYENW